MWRSVPGSGRYHEERRHGPVRRDEWSWIAGVVGYEVKVDWRADLRAETPRITPTPMPLAMPVKRLLRTQGISLMREKSENDNLCTPKFVRRDTATRRAGVPLSLHECRSTYPQKFQRFQRTRASLAWPALAWKGFPSPEQKDIFPRSQLLLDIDA